jgi:mannosyl-3-phosphoglycerate phosphatase
MRVIFTDLDGTLLDHETYSLDLARPALERLRRAGIPVVFTSSKTRAESEPLRRAAGNSPPFISENGGALYVPAGYFPFPLAEARRDPPYDVIEYGAPYEALTAALARASQASGCRVRGFSELSVEEVAALCGLPLESAARAKLREFDEPFQILGEPPKAAALLEEIERMGLRWTRGGRFHHILGGDKARAVRTLLEFYRRAHGEMTSVGLGDGPNDVDFLNLVDVPILVRSGATEKIQAAVRNGRVTAACGPRGWTEAISEMLPE